jgi:hypothetical protein
MVGTVKGYWSIMTPTLFVSLPLIIKDRFTSRANPRRRCQVSRTVLALIDSSQGRHIDCTALAKTIRSQWQRMRQNHPWFDFVVLPSRTVVGKDLKRKIWDWLRNSVTVFYLYGHGCGRTQNLPPVAYWGTINFWSELPQHVEIRRSLQQRPELRKTMHFIVPEITAGRQYTFAFMDACNTAAAHTNENPGREDDAFARAFNIGTNVNYSSCFAGWNGNSGAVSLQTTGGEWVAPSIWLQWRQRFWTLLGDGYYVSQAFTLACQRTPREPGINPMTTDALRNGKIPQFHETIVIKREVR